MSTRSSIRIKRRVVSAALLVCALPVFAGADKKQEMYDQAMKAGSASRVEEAARLFCDLAKLDPNYKDAKQMCSIMTNEVALERKKSDDRFAEGVKLFQEGRFDDAEQRFKNVRAGSHVDEAKDYLAKLPGVRQGIENENAKFAQGKEAYRNNDFATAKSALAQVTGRLAPDAQPILDNIKRYEEATAAGDSASAAKDWPKAIASYSAAAAIKPDGPGDPRSKLARVQTLAKEAPPQPVPTAPPAIATHMPGTGVVKEPAKVDIAKLLREATNAQAQGKYPLAAGKYLAVLAADPANEVARRGLEFVTPKTGGSVSVGSEADAMLARAIREFYQGFYDDSEVHIKDYLRFNGSRTGLSNFYLGAIGVTKYYLAGARDSDRKFLADAKTYFQLARGTAGFNPPDQNVISPKILKVYSGQGQ